MPAMTNRREYLLVFLALGFLTAVEIWVAKTAIGNIKIWTLIALAMSKAVCVAAFYMHLKTERNWLRIIAALPLLAGIFAYVLIREGMYR